MSLSTHCFLHFVAVHLSVSLLYVPFLSLSFAVFFLSDKLDEILAAAQQTISTNEAPGTRGQGPKRDRGRSFYGNEVCIVKHTTLYLCVCSCVDWDCHQVEKSACLT